MRRYWEKLVAWVAIKEWGEHFVPVNVNQWIVLHFALRHLLTWYVILRLFDYEMLLGIQYRTNTEQGDRKMPSFVLHLLFFSIDVPIFKSSYVIGIGRGSGWYVRNYIELTTINIGDYKAKKALKLSVGKKHKVLLKYKKGFGLFHKRR